MGPMEHEQVRRDLEYLTKRRELPEGESFAAALKRLDELARSPELDARFAHFLSRRSYVKALAWLENPEIPHLP